MWLANVVRKHAYSQPDRIALRDEQRSVTWAELDARTDNIAHGLHALGVRKGDRVLTISGNYCHTFELFVAAAKHGFIVCPVNPAFPLAEIQHITKNVQPSVVFFENEPGDEARALWAEIPVISLQEEGGFPKLAAESSGPFSEVVGQEDPFGIFHTSATTGRAKGVLVSHRSLAACFLGLALEAELGPEGVMLVPCPVFHGSVVIPLAFLAAGGQVVLESSFVPQKFLHDVQKYRPTSAFLVPSMVLFALQAKSFDEQDMSSFKEIMYGAAPMPVPLLKTAITRFGCPFRTIYGITEGGGPIATHQFTADDLAKPEAVVPWDSSGRMLLGFSIKVRDLESGRSLGANEVGEICVDGDGTMMEYWQNPEATNEIKQWGGIRTGDIGSIDEDGFIRLRDRINDTLIRGGQNVYPTEVERAIIGVEGVRDVAVVGVHSEEWGQTPVAFVVPDVDIDWKNLRRAILLNCRTELGSYKWPTAILPIAEIPRNPSGKILRRVLRSQYEDAQAQAETT